MTKIIAYDLVFPESIHFFGPRSGHPKHATHPSRHKVRGKVRLVTSQPTRLNEVEIMFHGQTQLNWKDPSKSQSSLLADKLSAFKILRKSKHVLLKQGTLPAGVTDLGFEVSIPGYLCPSFRSEFVDTHYIVSARIIPKGKFTKEMTVKRPVELLKTLMPKDVASGQADEYQVSRVIMRGERPGCLRWLFKVPRYVCLESCAGVEFEGIFNELVDNSVEIINMEVDVVQEEWYTNGMSKKRHLVVSSNPPSKYLYPPLDTPIALSFPLQPSLTDSKPKIRRVRSVPLRDVAHIQMQPSISTRGSSDSAIRTIRSHGVLTHSMESPYLKVRHFVRIVIHLANASPICIGLPLQITRRIDAVRMPDSLPSYQSVAQDSERLPDYYADKIDTENAEDDNGCADGDATEDTPEQDSVDEGIMGRQRKRDDVIALERSLLDFSVHSEVSWNRDTAVS